MVVHDRGELVRSHGGDCWAKILKTLIPGCKESSIFGVGVSWELVGCVEGTLERGEIESGGGIGDVGGWDEKGVDYLHHTAGERQVCLHKCASASLATDKDYHVSSLLDILNSLTPSNITPFRVGQQSRYESRRARY